LQQRANEHARSQQFPEAEELYTKAIALEPRDSTLWLNRGVARTYMKLFEMAEADAERAMALEMEALQELCEGARRHYSKSLAHHQIGKMKSAMEDCEAGLALEPTNRGLVQLWRAIEQLNPTNRKLPQRVKASQEKPLEKAQKPLASTPDSGCPASGVGKENIDKAKERTKQAAYQWKGREPSDRERSELTQQITKIFFDKYQELKARMVEHSKKSVLDNSQYNKDQKAALMIKGGHQPMERPDDIEMPADYRRHMGVLSVEELGKYDCDNAGRRYLLSVYGSVFDVSDRPDKYGPDGPYNTLVGHDITWGLFTGVDNEEYCNRFYDIWKAKDQGHDKLTGLCSWLAWYETEYGEPVGKLQPYMCERLLPSPPLEEVQDCVVQ